MICISYLYNSLIYGLVDGIILVGNIYIVVFGGIYNYFYLEDSVKYIIVVFKGFFLMIV